MCAHYLSVILLTRNTQPVLKRRHTRHGSRTRARAAELRHARRLLSQRPCADARDSGLGGHRVPACHGARPPMNSSSSSRTRERRAHSGVQCQAPLQPGPRGEDRTRHGSDQLTDHVGERQSSNCQGDGSDGCHNMIAVDVALAVASRTLRPGLRLQLIAWCQISGGAGF